MEIPSATWRNITCTRKTPLSWLLWNNAVNPQAQTQWCWNLRLHQRYLFSDWNHIWWCSGWSICLINSRSAEVIANSTGWSGARTTWLGGVRCLVVSGSGVPLCHRYIGTGTTQTASRRQRRNMVEIMSEASYDTNLIKQRRSCDVLA